jgi:hypothetical protein
MTSIQDMLAFERLIPERLRFEVTLWAIDHERAVSGGANGHIAAPAASVTTSRRLIRLPRRRARAGSVEW